MGDFHVTAGIGISRFVVEEKRMYEKLRFTKIEYFVAHEPQKCESPVQREPFSRHNPKPFNALLVKRERPQYAAHIANFGTVIDEDDGDEAEEQYDTDQTPAFDTIEELGEWVTERYSLVARMTEVHEDGKLIGWKTSQFPEDDYFRHDVLTIVAEVFPTEPWK